MHVSNVERQSLPSQTRPFSPGERLFQPLGSFILTAGLAQKATRSSALWIAWLGIVSGATLVVTTSWIAIGQHWIYDAGVIGLLLFLLWALASGISLLRKKTLIQAGHYA